VSSALSGKQLSVFSLGQLAHNFCRIDAATQSTPYVNGGNIKITSMLEHQEWTRWMTWIFQVMPVFFLVGGYSNGISWQYGYMA
jgi:hypothetical protein